MNQLNNLSMPEDTIYCLGDHIGGVSLIQSVGNDAMVVSSARVSFGKKIEKLQDKDRKLIKFLLEHHHGTPLEHNTITFLVKCPLFVARQWMRHRIASYNEISYRYVEATDEFYIPHAFRAQSSSNRQASIEGDFSAEDQKQNIELYTKAINQSYAIYQQLLENGVAREQARGVLPLTTYTQYYFTCNLRALLHFIELRDHKDAQWEIQQYAQAMLKLIKPLFPETIAIWEDLKCRTQ